MSFPSKACALDQFVSFVAIVVHVVASDAYQLSDQATALMAAEVQHQMDRIRDLIPDRLIRQFDPALPVSPA